MKRKCIVLFLLIGFVFIASAQDKSLYAKHWFIQNGDTLPFRVLLPKDYNVAKPYPVIFFLHGRGESGRDNEKQLTHGAALFLKDSIRNAFPAIIIFPQCAADSYWSNVTMVTQGTQNSQRSFHFVQDGPPSEAMQLLLGLVDHVRTNYNINQQQVYAMGLSMGGMGTFELVRRKPKTFAAAVPICGGAHTATAKEIRKTAWWVFHGGKDDVVLPVYSETMVAALKKAKADVKYTLYPAANHNSWDPAFAEKDLLPWLFSHRRK